MNEGLFWVEFMNELKPPYNTIKRKSISGIIRKFSTHRLKKVVCQLIHELTRNHRVELELGHRGVLQPRWVQKVHRGGVYFEVYGGCAVEFI